MKITPWKVISSKIVFNNKWYKLRQDKITLHNGKTIDDYFVSERPEVVLIFPITKDNEVILVKQYKHGARLILTELPGGVFDEATETSSKAALRELEEETGYSSENIIHVDTFIDNPTKDTNKIHFFVAKNCELKGEQKLDDTENIEVVKVKIEDIEEFILNTETKVSSTLAGVYTALKFLNRIQ